MGGAVKFEYPVTVELDGKVYAVEEVAEAGRLLIDVFPLATDRRKVAMKAALAALRGDCDVEFARQRFIDASLEIFALKSA